MNVVLSELRQNPKFIGLYNGEFEYYFQTNADISLVALLIINTNKEDIFKIFDNSKLGVRAKAKRTEYREWLVKNANELLLKYNNDYDLLFRSLKLQDELDHKQNINMG